MSKARTLLVAASALVALSAAAWATDSDGDGLDDATEIALGTAYLNNPADRDSDGDGLDDRLEVYTLGTDPNNPDTDGDGNSDGYEVNTTHTDPLDPGTPDGVSAFTGTGYASSVGYALSGLTPTDGVGVMVHDGRLRYVVKIGYAAGVAGNDFVFPIYYDSSWASYDGYHGANWASPWLDTSYSVNGGTGDVTICRPPLGALTWTKSGANYIAPTGCINTLTKVGSDYVESTPQGFQWTYSAGKLASVADKFGNAITLHYSTGTCDYITDTRGEQHQIGYWAGTGRFKTLTMSDGRVWTASYSANADLMRIEGPATTAFPGGVWLEWRYISGSVTASLNHDMVRAIDGRGNPWMKVEWDANDRVTRQDVGTGHYSFDWTNIASQHTTVTSPLGNLRDWYWHSSKLTREQLVEQTNRTIRGGEPDYTTTWTTDSDGYPYTTTYPEGNGVVYTLNAASKLPEEIRRIADMGIGTAASDIVDAYRYDSGKFYGMTKHADPMGDILTSGCYTLYTLNSYGQPTTTTFPYLNGTSTTVHNYASYNADGTVDTTTDGAGNVTAYAYYSASTPKAGRVYTRAVDSTGVHPFVTTYDYDGWGNVVSITDPNSYTTTRTVDDYGCLLREDSDASLGYYTEYEYDGNLNVVAKHVSNIDENGTPRSPTTWDTSMTYTVMDKLDNLTEMIDGGTNRVSGRIYDVENNMTRFVRGGTDVNWTYDERGLVYRRIRDQAGAAATETYVYDGNRHVTSYTNARGNATTTHYDDFGRPDLVTNALGHYTTYDYDMASNVVRTRRYDVSTALMTDHKAYFDEMERQWKEEDWLDPPGSWVNRTMLLDGNGQPLTLTDRNANPSYRTYDGARRLSTDTDEEGNVLTYGYDYDGNVQSVVETEINPGGSPVSYETDFSYDAWSRKISQTVKETGGAGTHVTYFGWDSTRFLCTTTDPMTYVTTEAHDGLNRRTSRVEPISGGTSATTSYEYDDNDHLTLLTDDNGKKTKWEFDALNYHDKTTYDYATPPNATTRVTTFTPNANGDCAGWTDPNGSIVTQHFDQLDRLDERHATHLGSGVAGDDLLQWQYDAADRMIQATDNDSQVDFTWDTLGRKLTEVQTYGADAKTVTYTSYDDEGCCTVLDYPGGYQDNRTYDKIHRSKHVEDGSMNPVADFDVHGRGRRPKKTTLGNSTHTDYSYNGYRDPTQIDQIKTGPTTFAAFSYAWDANDNPLYEIRSHQGGHGDVYHYDWMNRLASATLDSDDPVSELALANSSTYDKLVEFTMDGVFNITQTDTTPQGGGTATATYPVDALNQYTAAAGATPGYDQNGNLTSDGTLSFIYDFQNQLIEADLGIVTKGTYVFDAVGRRIGKVTAGGTQRYIYDGDQIIEVLDGSNALLQTYVYGDGIDQVVMMDDGARHYYHTQLIGSVTQITNASQVVEESWEYGPYGETTIKDSGGYVVAASPLGNLYGYTGRQFDDETGLYYYRARNYSPTLRRFVQRDPMEYVDGPNALEYASACPTSRVDPLGLSDGKSWREKIAEKSEAKAQEADDKSRDEAKKAIQEAVNQDAAGTDKVVAERSGDEKEAQRQLDRESGAASRREKHYGIIKRLQRCKRHWDRLAAHWHSRDAIVKWKRGY